MVEVNEEERTTLNDEVPRTEEAAGCISSSGHGRNVGRLVMRSSASAETSSRDKCGERSQESWMGDRRLEGRRKKSTLKSQQVERYSAFLDVLEGLEVWDVWRDWRYWT